MKMMTACLLGLVLSAPQAPVRPPLQISVVESASGKLVGNAEVAIYAPNGLAIRRGETGTFGHPYNAEAVERIDPALRELRVVVRKLRGGVFFTETMTLVFERNAWRPKPKTAEPSNLCEERVTQVSHQLQLDQPPALPEPLTQNGLVEVSMRLPPFPVCRSAPWQAFVCGGVPYAPPGPPCGPIPPVPPPLAWLPSSMPPTGGAGTAEQEAAIHRQAAIVELGRPPVPEIEWAPFGGRWIAGPYGMFFHGRVLPPEAPTPETGRGQLTEPQPAGRAPGY